MSEVVVVFVDSRVSEVSITWNALAADQSGRQSGGWWEGARATVNP